MNETRGRVKFHCASVCVCSAGCVCVNRVYQSCQRPVVDEIITVHDWSKSITWPVHS